MLKLVSLFVNNNVTGTQCCGAVAALFGRSRSCEKRGGSGSSSTAQAPTLTLCLKKKINKIVNYNVKLN